MEKKEILANFPQTAKSIKSIRDSILKESMIIKSNLYSLERMHSYLYRSFQVEIIDGFPKVIYDCVSENHGIANASMITYALLDSVKNSIVNLSGTLVSTDISKFDANVLLKIKAAHDCLLIISNVFSALIELDVSEADSEVFKS